jgi:hypothetical protein
MIKLSKRGIETIIWILGEILAFILKIKKEVKNNEDNSKTTTEGTEE